MPVMIRLSVDRNEDIPVVKAELDTRNYSDNDIEVKWARLALRYMRQIEKEMTVPDQSHIEDIDAFIAFSRSDDELQGLSARDWDREADYSEWDEGLPFYDSPPSGNAMSIGFAWTVSDDNVLGGFSTAAPVYALSIYELLLDARSQVRLK